MSGGNWNYRDQDEDFYIVLINIPKILEALKKAFHEVDWAESGDTSRDTAEPRIYDIIKELGDELFRDELK